MNFRVIACALIAVGVSAVAGARTPVNTDVVLAAKSEAKAESRLAAAAAATTTGDDDSFGANVKYLGLMTTGAIYLQSDCTPDPTAPLGPEDHCILTNPAPASTPIAINDAARMIIPGKSTTTLICQAQTPVTVWTFYNPTASAMPNARFVVTPQYRIENEVLADPSLIDPTTGLPFNGAITVSLAGIRHSRSLQPGELQTERENASRTCIGGIVSRRQLVETYGLSSALAKKFFKKDTIITMNVNGSAIGVDFASIIYGTRMYGD
jgi:hypothetical protein